MTTIEIGHRLIALAGAACLWGCGPKSINEPPPQTPASVETPADAALPAVPLMGKGVIVPSDVKLQPARTEAAPPSGAPPGAVASPGAN